MNLDRTLAVNEIVGWRACGHLLFARVWAKSGIPGHHSETYDIVLDDDQVVLRVPRELLVRGNVAFPPPAPVEVEVEGEGPP